MLLCCGCSLHWKCLCNWLARGITHSHVPTCPTCRGRIPRATVLKEQKFVIVMRRRRPRMGCERSFQMLTAWIIFTIIVFMTLLFFIAWRRCSRRGARVYPLQKFQLNVLIEALLYSFSVRVIAEVLILRWKPSLSLARCFCSNNL